MNLINREDRIGKYLAPLLNNFLFDELSENYLNKSGLDDVLTGVPIPIRRDEIESVSTLTIAKGMAFVIGCDPKFEYRDNYIAYILRVSDKSFARALVAEGVDAAQKKDFDYACVQFRAAMLIDSDNVDAAYCYGRACKDAYELGEEEEFIARFKAESIEAFEEVTLRSPEFADAYYFLGYGYINLGLYVKAKLTWQDFIKLSSDEEKKQEIEERLSLIDEPVEIEEGYNLILSGKFDAGIKILSKYTEGRFSDWWPLWYYLGTAHAFLAYNAERQAGASAESERRSLLETAAAEFKRVLRLSPSNRDTMKELVKVYEDLGDEAAAEKYRKKILIISENIEKDKEEAFKGKKEKFS